jgi:hypothetical protein
MNIATDSRDIHYISLKRSFLSRQILQYINSCKEHIMDYHPPVLYSWVDIDKYLRKKHCPAFHKNLKPKLHASM